MLDEDQRWILIAGKDNGILEFSCDKLNLQFYTRGKSVSIMTGLYSPSPSMSLRDNRGPAL